MLSPCPARRRTDAIAEDDDKAVDARGDGHCVPHGGLRRGCEVTLHLRASRTLDLREALRRGSRHPPQVPREISGTDGNPDRVVDFQDGPYRLRLGTPGQSHEADETGDG